MTADSMKKTKCPTEADLNRYMIGGLSVNEKDKIEKHIADCPYCVYKISESYKIVEEVKKEGNIKKGYTMSIKKGLNVWLILSITMFLLSFLVPHYFVQFLTASILLGIKWIVDNKNTKMLIMIHEAWKEGRQDEIDRFMKKLDRK